MRFLSTFFLVSLLLSFCGNGHAQSFDEKVTSVSNVGMTVNNLGMIGNAFSGSYQVQDFPSCEYPRGSGIEHLFDGGLWVGAIKNGQARVSTGAVDDPSGYSTGKGGFEFTAEEGAQLKERSSLEDNPNFDPKAVSHQDFVANFTDKNQQVPGTDIPIQNHDNPLGIDIHYETYNWNFNFANFFVVLDFKITNTSDQTLDSFYTGYWMDGVVRNTNITPPGGAAFFNKGGNGYDDSIYTAYEFDAAGDTAYTKSYIGLKYLGAERNGEFYHPEVNDQVKVHFSTWQFQNSSDPLYFFPSNDGAKYNKMSLGLNQNEDLDWNTISEEIERPSNRSNLISVGSFGKLEPGESVNVAFAVVLGKMKETGNSVQANTAAQRSILRQNADWAQRSFNGEDQNFNGKLDPGEDSDGDGEIDRYILPSPPNIPNTRYVAKDGRIEVYWTDNAESSVDPITGEQDFEGYRLYKSEFGYDVTGGTEAQDALQLVAEFDKEGNPYFYNTGFQDIRLEEPKTFPDDTLQYQYRYTIDGLQSGWQHVVSLTAFDRGDEENNIQPLESSKLSNAKHVFPGEPPVKDMDKNEPFVYPNPYYASAQWRGTSIFEEDRKIMFANLPRRCQIRIYNVAGDLVSTIRHTQDYSGDDIEWYNSFSDVDKTKFSGGEHAWDLLSDDNQIVARGIYIFTVENLENGNTREGKFVLIK